MPKSVPNVPSYEEFFGLSDNVLTDSDFDPHTGDSDVDRMLVILLGLFQEFYLFHMYDSANYFVSDQFFDDIKLLNEDLKDNLHVLWNDYCESLGFEFDSKWRLPTGYVSLDFDLESLIETGIDSVTWTLYYDLRDKAMFYDGFDATTGEFLPHSNFRRGVKRLTNQVDFKSNHIRKTAERKYLEFVYGQEALFVWVCSGVNTCEWCYGIEAMGAMPLSWFPIDHINGACRLKPVNPDSYSNDYLEVRL